MSKRTNRPNRHKAHGLDKKVPYSSIEDAQSEIDESKWDVRKTENDGEDQSTFREARKSMRKFSYLAYHYVREMFLEDKAAFWTVIFTAVLTLFTYFLVAVTKQVDETTRATQRAYVSNAGLVPGSPLIDPSTQKVAFYRMWYSWGNAGTTPALRARGWINFKIDSIEHLPKDFNYPYDPNMPSIGFEIAAKIAMPSNAIKVPIDDVKEIAQHHKRLFIWGEVTYYDIFSNKLQHKTEFCNEIPNIYASSLDLTNPLTSVNIDNNTCPEHNCSDDTCKDWVK